MTVAELIAKLQTMDPNLPVSVNDETGGAWHEDVDFIYESEADEEYGDRACVVIVVNECV